MKTTRKNQGHGRVSLWLTIGLLLLSTQSRAQFNYFVYDGNFDLLPSFTTLTPIASGTTNTIDVGVTSQTDTFALLFERQIVVTTPGIYQFNTSSDDGSKLLIDGATVVDNDGLHAAQTVEGQAFLATGTYALSVEFFEKTGGETLAVNYRPLNGVYSAIPANGALVGLASSQFNYSVYDGSFDLLPDFSVLTPIATGTSDIIGLGVTSQVETFGLVFTHQLTVSVAANYQFSTTSDDGSKLAINGVTVVDNDGLHGAATVQGSVFLNPGVHALRVEFFEKNGGELLDVLYRIEGGSFTSIPASGILDGTVPAKSVVGDWGSVINWPEIAISAANLPDGRVLTWSSTETNAFPSSTEFTHASVFDPSNESFITVDSNFHDMFCAGIATLEDGRIVASGGNPDDDRTSAFDPATLSWSSLANMFDRRWYATSVALPDNSVFSTFGKSAGNRSERYVADQNSWTRTLNADMQTLLNEQNSINAAANPTGALNMEWWGHMATTPAGDVFQGGPTPTWHRFDPLNGAATESLGQMAGTRARMYGNAVTYDVGKVILVGGADRRENPSTTTANVYLVDLNGPTPVVTQGPPMNRARALSNTVTLPNGEILVVGGNTSGKIFSDEGTVYPAEIYDPVSNSWRLVDSIDIPRNYHSTALLLKDGRVLSAGGGACGNCAANHLDGQIFSPPYLFDAQDNLAVRPALSNVPAQAQAGQQILVTASGDTAQFSMVRLSGTTHHMNTDQRFVPISSIDNGDGTFTLSLQANPNVLIMGNYYLFAVNANGTPSVAETIQVVRAGMIAPSLPAGGAYISDLTWSLEQNGSGPAERDTSNGESAAGDGAAITLNGQVYPKGVGVHANSRIEINLAGQYASFASDIGLDDERDGLCGKVRFTVEVDGVEQLVSGTFEDTTATESIIVDVSGANILALVLSDGGGGLCGDRGDWAAARLLADAADGFRYYRFTPTKLRDDNTATAVQLSEFSFFHLGAQLFSPTATNPAGSFIATESPNKSNDGNLLTRWTDSNKGALLFDFGADTLIDGYHFATANDGIERDPVRWVLEGSRDASSWTIIDDQSGQDFSTPLERFTFTNQFGVDLTAVPDIITALPQSPHNSTTLIVENSTGNDRIWNVNPDNNTVSVSDHLGNLLQEITVGDRPWSLAKSPITNQLLVTNKGDASVSVVDTSTLAVVQTILLPEAAQPHGLIYSIDGLHYYVVLEATAQLQKRDASTHTLIDTEQLSGRPRHVSMSYDSALLYISNFVTPPLIGEATAIINLASGAAQVFEVSPLTMTLTATRTLPYDGRALSESQGPGIPNYLNAPVFSFDNQFAYIPSKKDNIDSGQLRLKPGMTFEFTVRANTSRLAVATGLEDNSFRVDLDNASVPTGAALSGDNRYLFVALETSRELAVYDTQNGFQLMRLPTERAPQGVALSSDGSQVFVHNFMSRSVSRFDLTAMLQQHLPVSNVLTTIDVVGNESLASNVLLGKQHFYDAADDRLARDNYMSCASCHNDGGQDGRVWDLTHLGEGLRNTIGLRGRGAGHGILHWTANFDEVQDFENQIRTLSLGTGLMTQLQFDSATDPLGAPKLGMSADLDALADYVNSLVEVDASPYRDSAATMSADALAGQSLFVSRGCIGCHAGSSLTDSNSSTLHDVGTITTDSGNRIGQALLGFDSPSVLGLWNTAPFLHNGSATTIQQAVEAHSSAATLPAGEISDLVSFVQQVGPAEAATMVDSDGDGVLDFADSDSGNPCVPSAFVAACGLDSDGDGSSDFNEGAFADSDGDGAFDYLESSIVDSDSDGINNQADATNNDACLPNVFNASCATDSDGDGQSDFAEGELSDSDSDGVLDYLESSLVDTDSDGIADQSDATNNDACTPSVFNANCATDSDGDGQSDFAEGALIDSDADGLFDYQESSLIDTDGDGVNNQFDATNSDACTPSVFNANCATDTDGDGQSDFAEGELVDTDGDGLFDYQESSLLDIDNDGVSDQNDATNSDACTPDTFNANCASDTDGDGQSDFSEGALVDSDGDGVLNYLESSLVDSDSDGVNDQDDATNNDACLPSVFNTECSQDTDGDGLTDGEEGELSDSDGDGTVDYLESAILDSDNDGSVDQSDADNNDACIPSVFNALCAVDSDADGSTDFAEGELTDTDGDGLLDYQESSITDNDGDSVSNQLDPENDNVCMPHPVFCEENVPMLGPYGIGLLGLLMLVLLRRPSIQPLS